MVPLRPGSQSSSNPLSPHLFRKRKTMRLSRPLSDLVKYTKAVRVHDIETQGKRQHPSTSVNIRRTFGEPLDRSMFLWQGSRTAGRCRRWTRRWWTRSCSWSPFSCCVWTSGSCLESIRPTTGWTPATSTHSRTGTQAVTWVRGSGRSTWARMSSPSDSPSDSSSSSWSWSQWPWTTRRRDAC